MNKSKENIYDIVNVKRAVLINFWSAYGQIWKANGIDTSLEEELMFNAIFKVLDKDTGSREQYEELLGVSYMLQGIGESLQSRHKVMETIDKTEPAKINLTENEYTLFEDDWIF